jgi:hypothetical protein
MVATDNFWPRICALRNSSAYTFCGAIRKYHEEITELKTRFTTGKALGHDNSA